MKVGIVGSGMIAKMALGCIKVIENVEVTALYCREVDRERAAQMCAEYQVSALYLSRDDL